MMRPDRLPAQGAAAVSPPAPSRPSFASPSRRASNLSPRLGYSPRTSSLALSNGESPVAPYAPSGKLQTEERGQSTGEPLQVLAKLLGRDDSQTRSTPGHAAPVDRPSIAVGELDFRGLSLRDFLSSEADGELEDARTPSAASNVDYEQEISKFEDLHQSVRACNEVLRSVEMNLTSFQKDLATVSAEIETLQARSTALTKRMENRKIIERGLGPVVEEISLSPAVVKKIVDGPIDHNWIKALAEVEKRSKAIESKIEEQRTIKGISDLKPLLENLIAKALERIRDFLIAQVKALRSPNINAQIIQQQYFLRYKDLFTFLHKRHTKLAEEICQAYMNTMRWYYTTQFTRYLKALETVKVHVLDRQDVLGQEDEPRKVGLLGGAKLTTVRHDAFNLGRRIDLLKSNNQTALTSFLAEEDLTTHYLEFPFRHFNLAMVDNASVEYTFLTSFFSPAMSYSVISRHFSHVFDPVFALGQRLTKTLITDTHDCLGLLLCVRLTQRFAFQLQRRKIPAVDGYINATNMLLWPRFQVVMDAHHESVRAATAALPSSTKKVSAAEAAKQSAAPHALTQRFAQFVAGILALSTEAGDDEPVSTSLIRLRTELETFLDKASRQLADQRKRDRFLENNWSLVLTIVGDVEGKLASEMIARFEQLRRKAAEAS